MGEKDMTNTTPTPPLAVTRARYAGGLSVAVTFSDGTERTVDTGGHIRRHPHPQYDKYLDPRKLAKFSIEHGNIVWGRGWDPVFPVELLHQGRTE